MQPGICRRKSAANDTERLHSLSKDKLFYDQGNSPSRLCMARIGLFRKNLLDVRIGQFSVEFMFGEEAR
jgi:hypothetical protein